MSPPDGVSKGRGGISDEATLRLWVQSGGRCEYHGCNEYLLEDELTTYALNFAERAHIVGANTTAASDAYDRLMLSCRFIGPRIGKNRMFTPR